MKRITAAAIIMIQAALIAGAWAGDPSTAEEKETTAIEDVKEAAVETDAAPSEDEEPEEPEPIPIVEYDLTGVEEFVRPDLIPAIEQICAAYNVCPEMVEAMIEKESGGIESVDNTLRCIGLMGVSEYWNADRMERLNAMNLYDGKQNILVGVDLLAELFADMEDPYEVLNFYGGWEYSEKGNTYIFEILDRAQDLEHLHEA